MARLNVLDLVPDPGLIEEPNVYDGQIIDVLKAFAGFSDKFYDYFEQQGLQNIANELDIRTRSLEARIDSVLEDYWRVIGRILEHRHVPHYREKLDKGTRLAEHYLQKLLIELPPPLLYFDKVAVIKHIPYTDVPLIGIPFINVINNEPEPDWQAIPHELGHYIYWNLGYKAGDDGVQPTWQQGELTTTLHFHEHLRRIASDVIDEADPPFPKAAKTMILGWQEEIVADIIGSQLAAEAFLESYKKILLNDIGENGDLVKYDQHHPAPCLRFFIRSRTLYGSKDIDLNDFFFREFDVERIGRMELNFSEAVFEERDLNEQLELHEFMEQFRTSADQSVVAVTVARMRDVLFQIVDRFKKEIDTILGQDGDEKYIGRPIELNSTFERLKQEVEKIAESTGQNLNKVLLRPRILEQGATHTHNLGGYHWTGVRWKWSWHYLDDTHDENIGE